ncbi:MAG TPA: dTDP-4-dehydrorhamnose 3,5-epimerase family protein [Patescibacteria group bacterium]
MTPDLLTADSREVYTIQSYEKAPQIEGVVAKDIACFVDDGGYFMELGRFDKGISQLFPDFEAKQMSYSQVLPGAVKAFHLHMNQEDVWFIPPHERLLVVLSDQRENSPTKGVTMRFVMGGGKSRLLYIPRGVAHGAANLGDAPASIIYFVNQQFNLEKPDEGRLPWDFLGADIWEMTKG